MQDLICEVFKQGFDRNRDDKGRFAPGGRGDLVPAPADRSAWPAHIQELKVPPAWSSVQINENPQGDLLVIGKDTKGRDQYVYSKQFQQSQAEAKFERISELDAKFDKIRAENSRNMKSNDPVLREHAECASLIMEMGVRPGSTADTGAKVQAFGATTLRGSHVVVRDGETRLQFTGKKGVNIDLPVQNRGLASMLRTRAAAAGADGDLFPSVNSGSILEYSHTMNGGKFKTKDFRTLVGTRTARDAVAQIKPPTTERAYKSVVKSVATTVSERLGNTPTVAL